MLALPSRIAACLVPLFIACGGNRPTPMWTAPEPAPPVQDCTRVADASTPEREEPAVSDGSDRKDDGTQLLEGTPEVPEELKVQLQAYLGTRSASLRDLSADGKRVLIATRFGDTSQLHLVREPLGVRTQLTFGDEPVSDGRFVPGDDRAIVLSADVGGNEKHQIYRRDISTGRARMLTSGDSRTGDMLWSWDGKQLAYRSNARSAVDFDIWVSDGADPASARKVVEASGYWQPLDWSRDGKKLLVGEEFSANESRVHLVDLGSGTVTALTPASPPSANHLALFSKSGKSVYIVSDREGEFNELYEVELADTTSWRPLTRDIPWDVQEMALSADGKTLAFVVNADGYDELRFLDTKSRKHKAVAGIPKGLVSGLRFARKAAVLGLTLAGATQVGDVYTYDLKRRKLTRWTESETGGLDPAELVEPTLVRYVTFDGAQIPAFYYRPAGKGPFPVVIVAHGGPESQARPRFSISTQFLVAELGIAVIYPNVRGSAGYGKSYLLLDNGVKREDSVKDIGALLDWIAARPELDGDRVAITGGSYGGYMVLASLVHFGDRITAGVDRVGISNFVTFLENTGEYRRDLRRAEYGDERDPEMRAQLERISPLTRASEIRSALFVVQGANDPRVPASEAEQIVAAVRKAGQPVWYMLARNEGHGFRKKENRDLYLELYALFLKTHLTAAESPMQRAAP